MIIKPIFIIGSGRSGTTILYNLLSTHPELCWFSNISTKYPKISIVSFMNKIVDIPYFGNVVKKKIIEKGKFIIKPSEGGKIYHCLCGFESDIKMTEQDIDKINLVKFIEIPKYK